jgi:hypothetical protein
MKTEQRIDQVTAMLLDAAVNTTRGGGPIPAALETLRLDISPETITRVLNQPEKRRAHANSKSDDAWPS